MLSLRKERMPRPALSELTVEKVQKTNSGSAFGEVTVSSREEIGRMEEQLHKY